MMVFSLGSSLIWNNSTSKCNENGLKWYFAEVYTKESFDGSLNDCLVVIDVVQNTQFWELGNRYLLENEIVTFLELGDETGGGS